MVDENLLKEVNEKAIGLFKSGIAQDRVVQKSGKVERPIPIQGPGGEIVSWFVGITVGQRLAGFMQFKDDLTLMRYSTFQRHASSLDSCPIADTWLNPSRVLEMAKTKACPTDDLESPFMTYDCNLTRIVWAVRATSNDGERAMIFVAGEYVYLSDLANES